MPRLTLRFTCLACSLLALACGDDGGMATDGGTPTTTLNPPSESSDTEPGTVESTATETSAGTPPGDADTTRGDDSDDATETGEPPAAVCPDGPFADSPLSSPMVTAMQLPNTGISLYPGGLVEGPVWIDGALYLSHFGPGPEPQASILRYTPGGSVEEFISGSGSNGLAVDDDGMILAATHDDGGLSRYALDGTRTSIVAEYEGTRLNSPNDLTLRSDGTIYFTDPSWQASNPNPQPITGVYRVDPEGNVHLEDGGQSMPNGISLSPDESLLYVGTPGGVVRYDVAADGTLGAGSPFGAALGLNSVDGMAVDCAGNVYVSIHNQGQIRVVDPGGNELGVIMVAPSVTNSAFGGDDGRTLFITAGDPNNGEAIYSVELAIPGYPY